MVAEVDTNAGLGDCDALAVQDLDRIFRGGKPTIVRHGRSEHGRTDLAAFMSVHNVAKPGTWQGEASMPLIFQATEEAHRLP